MTIPAVKKVREASERVQNGYNMKLLAEKAVSGDYSEVKDAWGTYMQFTLSTNEDRLEWIKKHLPNDITEYTEKIGDKVTTISYKIKHKSGTLTYFKIIPIYTHIEIISAGQDKVFNTSDDIRKSFRVVPPSYAVVENE